MAKVIRTIAGILSVICLGLVIFFSLKSSVRIPDFVKGGDKTMHFLAYIAVSFLLFVTFCNFTEKRYILSNILPFLGAILLAFAVGYTVELCQPAFGRSFELYDILADALGSVLGALLGFVFSFTALCIHRRKK